MDEQPNRRQLLDPLKLDRAALAAGTVAALCLAGFVLVNLIIGQPPTELDRRLLYSMRLDTAPGRLIGPDWMEHVVIGLSVFGGGVTLSIIILAAFVRLLLDRHSVAGWWVLLAGVSGFFWERSLKVLLGRPRPTVVPHLEQVTSPSMPSGHAMMSAMVYLTMALLVSRLVARRIDKAAVVAAAVAFTVLIGSTRVLLGVHNPTDVLAGWLFGAAWALLCWLAARAAQARLAG